MKKKIVYIAHPIGGDVEGNLERLNLIYNELSKDESIIPFIPYYATVMGLDDSDPDAREKGMRHNYEFFYRNVIDEVWLYGDRISSGMEQEILWADEHSIPVFSKTEGTKR